MSWIQKLFTHGNPPIAIRYKVTHEDQSAEITVSGVPFREMQETMRFMKYGLEQPETATDAKPKRGTK